MPPLRSSSGRASKACDLCRKCKTRCYTSSRGEGSCLRCETLSQVCSLGEGRRSVSGEPLEGVSARGHIVNGGSGSCEFRQQPTSVDARLSRLERTVDTLVDRLDARLNNLISSENNSAGTTHVTTTPTTADSKTAPVFLLRDAATDAGVHSLDSPETNQMHAHSDVMTTGLVSTATAHKLLGLFYIHYGRWVKFPEDISTAILLQQTRRSPILLCSIFLIAVRHTTQDLADRLAPKLFQEAKRLVTSSLLVVPQPIQFFQAILILSLWPTTIGQVPLSIDSWLLTGYALQQAMASSDFVEVFRGNSDIPAQRSLIDAWCLWNHLCLAHLQYCVGTRRQALLNQEQINHCLRLIDSDNITNYEARMVAEISLYWIIYRHYCGPAFDLPELKHTLQTWRRVYTALFEQPRSQFLQMGFHFAHLIAYGQSLRSPTKIQDSSAAIQTIVIEMVHHSTAIINLAIQTADDRTRHLTDHIYHIVTFSALTLCRLLHTYEDKLTAANHDVGELDNLVVMLVDWLRSIGLPCHAAHMLAAILTAQFHNLRPMYIRQEVVDGIDFRSSSHLASEDGSLNYEFSGSEFFNIAMDTTPWPQWGPIYTDDGMQ